MPPPGDGPPIKAFVGGISWHLDDEGLRALFSKYGATSASVMLDRTSRRSRGFGFVYFSSPADLDAAIAEVHGTEVEGRTVSVTRAVPQKDTAPGTPAAALGGGRDAAAARGDPVRRGRSDDRGPPPPRQGDPYARAPPLPPRARVGGRRVGAPTAQAL